MSEFTQKYTIVHFFEDIEEGRTYPSSEWPLHSTIIDTFAIDWSIDEMAVRLKEALGGHAIAESEAEEDTYFGENGQVHVTLLRRTESLAKLHFDVLAVLKDGGVVLNDPQFAESGFLPHVTVQKHARLKSGDKVQFTALSVVDMFPVKDPYMRKVLKTIKIG